MSTDLPKPSGSDLSMALNYCNIPHTKLNPTQDYTLSDISDNCRSNSATFLRVHLPKKPLPGQLRYLTTELSSGNFMLVGRKGNHVKVGLLQNKDNGSLFHIDRRIVLLGDGVFKKKTHPLQDEFEQVEIAYFLCSKFEEHHLVKPFLYRKRKAKQLKKIIDKREATKRRNSQKTSDEKNNDHSKRNKKKSKKNEENDNPS